MRLPASRPRYNQGFSLIELLMVLAIMAILISVAMLSLRGINSSGNFNLSLNQISGVLEQARSYAVAQDTYVWVALYENDQTSTGLKDVYVAAFASNDGTDPFNWTGSVTFPTPGTVGGTTLSQVTHMTHCSGLHLQTTSMPNAPSSPSLPANLPVFQCTAPSSSGPVTLSGTSAVYWVIQFTPTGAARVGPNPIQSIWFGVQPSLSQTAVDTKNIASLEVSGLTGLTTINRP